MGCEMTQVNIDEAKNPLSKLIEKVKKGEEIVIAEGNKPVAKLVLIDDLKPKRRLNSAKGLVVVSEDFDSLLEDL